MTHRGPCQPRPFCDSVTCFERLRVNGGSSSVKQEPANASNPTNHTLEIKLHFKRQANKPEQPALDRSGEIKPALLALKAVREPSPATATSH